MLRSREVQKGQLSHLFPQGGRRPLSEESQVHLAQQLTPEPVRRWWETQEKCTKIGTTGIGTTRLRCFCLDFLEIYICGQKPDYVYLRNFLLYF